MHDSKAFYNIFANTYQSYANEKADYLEMINKMIVENRLQAVSMIDIGSGDGIRSKKIASKLGVEKLTLMDNSQMMVSRSKTNVKDAETIYADITSSGGITYKYEVVSCLWNVLGHIPTESLRIKALHNMAFLMENNSTLYLDINNRYNISQYGIWNVCRNILKDIFLPRSQNGDFPLKVKVDGREIKTSVHLFTRKEIRKLLKLVGLTPLEEKFINYKTGTVSPYQFSGQIFYIVKKKI